jgi:hypothetical protein
MIVQTIHEIVNPFDVEVNKLGYGVAIFMIAGSIHSNPQFIVRFYNTGELRTVDQNDLLVYGNPSAGESLTPLKSNEKVSKGSRWGIGAVRNTDFLKTKNHDK